jgi:hypothetical protein
MSEADDLGPLDEELVVIFSTDRVCNNGVVDRKLNQKRSREDTTVHLIESVDGPLYA